ncbi:flagellar basal-body rod protein FlgF [Pararhizobium haloflavum]|uniref:flagellar basal-body rod protein FlgF n=1 Tax=Pararhizobium haloflavum TaxID=2037914 RepID=UPI000C1744C2|nr:flagellar basal-body rod protein FlgF [Pararhizobium haloflavum]
MDTALYVGLSAQIALEKRLTTLADNVANANTVGFRSTEVKFESLVDRRRPADVDFVSSGSNYLSTENGGLNQTGNSLDFAVRGEGWFAIDTPAGQALTRDGRFTMTQEGALVTLNGYPVLDAGGAPIQLDPLAGPPEAGNDGTLLQNGAQVSALGLFAFDPNSNYRRFENSAIIPDGEAEPIVDRFDAGVVQGYVEQSNVNPVAEMTRLIMVTRAFENASALMRASESTTEEAIRTLGGRT